MNTATLLLRLRDGDEAAWTPLVQRFEPRLRLHVRHRLGTALARRVEVDDILQETWIRALPRAARFEGTGESAFYRFLATVAGHVLIDAAREARARKRVAPHRRSPGHDGTARGDPSSVGGVRDDTAGPATRADRAERAAMLERAFATLPARHRRVLALRQFEQRPAREAAVLLGISEGAVHALFRRALDAWAAAYENLGGSGPA